MIDLDSDDDQDENMGPLDQHQQQDNKGISLQLMGISLENLPPHDYFPQGASVRDSRTCKGFSGWGGGGGWRQTGAKIHEIVSPPEMCPGAEQKKRQKKF